MSVYVFSLQAAHIRSKEMTRQLLTIAVAICWLEKICAHDPAIISVPYPRKSQLEPSKEYNDCGGMPGGLSLNIRDAGLRHIHSDFINSSSISHLDLDNNGIVDVSPTAFRYLPNLLYLNLSRNEFSVAEFGQLEGHPSLCALILDGNNASSAGATVKFEGTFPRLRQLHLCDNGIKGLASLGFAPMLEKLYLSANDLDELSFLEDAPSTLRSLDLAETGVRGFKVGELASLEELVLNGNRIESLCGGAHCDGDSTLALGGAGKLRRLLLSRNALASIEPGAFNDTENLLELDLSRNQLESIPEGTFEPLQELQTLSLRGNRLAEVPHLCGPDALLHLSLADNRIEAVRNDSFCVMEMLRLVDLSRNRIRSIESDAFVAQPYLEVLDLSYNQLTRLADYWLKPLWNLTTLIADGNRFESLRDAKLARSYGSYSSKLENVYLRNNSIAKIDSKDLYYVLKSNPRVTIEIFTDEQMNGLNSESEITECKCDCDDNQV